MKLMTVVALAALAVGGSATAQRQDQSGVPAPMPSTTPVPGKDVPYRPGAVLDLLTARYQLRRACAPDMLARCAGKDGAAADRCLEYHRLSFTLPCKKAITAFERVAPPRASFESLASLQPISGPIPPEDQRLTPKPDRSAARAGSGD